MFDIFKKQKKYLVAPVSGDVIKLSDVQDEVFSSGMMGIGLAIIPKEGVFVAPADGVITILADSKHAFGMRLSNGLEVLVHIGMDTVNLGGRGFEALVRKGQEVTAGTPIIRVNIDFFREKNISLITPIIVLNYQDYSVEILVDEGECRSKETKIIKF